MIAKEEKVQEKIVDMDKYSIHMLPINIQLFFITSFKKYDKIIQSLFEVRNIF